LENPGSVQKSVSTAILTLPSSSLRSENPHQRRQRRFSRSRDLGKSRATAQNALASFFFAFSLDPYIRRVALLEYQKHLLFSALGHPRPK